MSGTAPLLLTFDFDLHPFVMRAAEPKAGRGQEGVPQRGAGGGEAPVSVLGCRQGSLQRPLSVRKACVCKW